MDFALGLLGASLLAVIAAIVGLQQRIAHVAATATGTLPYRARRPLDRGQLLVHEALKRACPEHLVLADVPLGRLVAVAEPAARRWARRVRDLDAHFVVCDAAGDVIAAVEVFGAALATDAEHERRREKERILESAGIRVVRLRANRLPDDARLRDLFAPPARVPEGRRRPAWLRVVK